jgi:Ca2+/Na+ antiporter
MVDGIKSLKWLVMYLIKTIFRVSAFMPMLIALGIVLLLVISFLKLGYMPQYGIEKDPYTVFSSGFLRAKDMSLIVSFYLLIASFISLVVLLIIRVNNINRKEKIIAIGMYAIGILILVLLRESSVFEWLVD